MNSQDVLSKLQGNYDMDAGAIDNIINSATSSFDNNWRSKLSEQIGLDDAKKEQIDELTSSAGLGLQMGFGAYKKIKAQRAKLKEGKASKLKKGESEIKENETPETLNKDPLADRAGEAPREVQKANAQEDGSGSARGTLKTEPQEEEVNEKNLFGQQDAGDEELPEEVPEEASSVPEVSSVPEEVSSSVPEEASSSVPEVSSEGVGSGEGIFGKGVDATTVDLDGVEGSVRSATLRVGRYGISRVGGKNMFGANIERRIPNYSEGQGMEAGNVAPSRIAYPDEWSNSSEISSDFFRGKPTITSSVPKAPVEAPKAPVEVPNQPVQSTPASAPEETPALDTGEEGANIVSDASQRVASSINATVADGSEAVNGAINAGKTALKAGVDDLTATATEGLAGAIGETGMTALGVLGDVAPPVAILAGVGLGIYDLFHHEHAPHDPPKAPAISTALSRHGLVMPSSDGVVDAPASNSAF